VDGASFSPWSPAFAEAFAGTFSAFVEEVRFGVRCIVYPRSSAFVVQAVKEVL
jgi:hypothetical protein